MAPPSPQAALVLSLLDLPLELLVKCIGSLPLKERLGPVSLVCRRLAAAARNPELLRELDVGELLNLAAVRSFTAFLAAPNKFLEEADPKPAYGQQLQRLKLSCADGTAEGKARAAAAVTACLMQAGASGQLTELSAGGCIRGTEWLPAMRSLRRLELTAKSVGTTPLRITPLRILPAISGLTALGSLELSWYHISFEGGARLPPSITFLVIEDDYPRNAHDLPEQIVQLPRLEHLRLFECCYSRDSMDQLSRLAGSLTGLDLTAEHVPTALSALTRLASLHLWGSEFEEQHLGASLLHLTQLTYLVVSNGAPIAGVAALSNLQYCELGWVDTPLPNGPWLRSLQWLDIGVSSLMSSLPALQAASNVTALCVTDDRGGVDWRSPAAAALFDALARNPHLKFVSFNCSSADFDSAIFAGRVAKLCNQRPGLVRVHAAKP